MSATAFGFADLIAPLTVSELLALWRGRTPSFQQPTGETRLTALLDWDTLRRSIVEGVIPIEKCRVTYNTQPVPPLLYCDNSKVNGERFAQIFEKGASLIVQPLEPYLPAIRATCRTAMTDGIRIVKVCAIVTTGSGRALSLHYDAKDLIIMQVEGSKRWRIYGPPVANPVIGMANETPPEGGPLFDTVLQPGDIAFMPAGYWHECDNGPDRSLHVLLLLDPPVDGTS